MPITTRVYGLSAAVGALAMTSSALAGDNNAPVLNGIPFKGPTYFELEIQAGFSPHMLLVDGPTVKVDVCSNGAHAIEIVPSTGSPVAVSRGECKFVISDKVYLTLTGGGTEKASGYYWLSFPETLAQ